MFGLLEKRVPCSGFVSFPGTIAPRAEEFAYLRKLGIEVRRVKARKNDLWALACKHPEWGEAIIRCDGEALQIPPFILKHCIRLSPVEQAEAARGQVEVSVLMRAGQKNILRDRKHLLRYFRAVMGEDGVVACDLTSEDFWSRAALDDELCHDADLDVSAIYTVHAVSREQDQDCGWLHTHGLDRVGAFDFDIIRPMPELFGTAADILRATAMAILERKVTSSTAQFDLFQPGGRVRFVEAADFQRHAPAADAALREDDDRHTLNHAVLCEPAGRLLGRFSKRVRPAACLSKGIDEGLFTFSEHANAVMAERARRTFEVFRSLREEFADLEFPTLVKLGYRTDGGGAGDVEHLWFTLHDVRDGRVDATLENQPFGIERMKIGQRAWHDLSQLTDWMIWSVAGPITPRSLVPARVVRERRDDVMQMMAQSKAAG